MPGEQLNGPLDNNVQKIGTLILSDQCHLRWELLQKGCLHQRTKMCVRHVGEQMHRPNLLCVACAHLILFATAAVSHGEAKMMGERIDNCQVRCINSIFY